MRRNPLGDNAECERLRTRRNSLNFQISRLHQDQERLDARIRSIEIRIADKEADLRALGRDTFNPQPHDTVDADRRRRGRERPKTPWGVFGDAVGQYVQDLRRRWIESEIRDLRREADPFIRERMRVTAQRNDLIAERARKPSIRCAGPGAWAFEPVALLSRPSAASAGILGRSRSNRSRIALRASGIAGLWTFKQKPPPACTGGGSFRHA